jgi:RNA-directed DNA polymerase
VLGLVKAFCKAGVLTETGHNQATLTGTPQGGILSPLLANIALSALDEHVHGPWVTGGVMSTPRRRAKACELAGRPLRRRLRHLKNSKAITCTLAQTVAVLRGFPQGRERLPPPLPHRLGGKSPHLARCL